MATFGARTRMEHGPITDRQTALRDPVRHRDARGVTENNDDINGSDPADALRFTVALQVWHPSIDPEALTRAFGRTPVRSWRGGAPRTTMQGEPLSGHWPESYWVARRRVERQRAFLTEILCEVGELEVRSELVARLLDEGGNINIRLSLPGDTNIGDVLPASVMRRLGTLGVGLDIEVFPEMD